MQFKSKIWIKFYTVKIKIPILEGYVQSHICLEHWGHLINTYRLSVRATLPVPKSVLQSEDTLRTHSDSRRSLSLMPRFRHCLLFSFQQCVNAANVSWSMTEIKNQCKNINENKNHVNYILSVNDLRFSTIEWMSVFVNEEILSVHSHANIFWIFCIHSIYLLYY